MSQHLLRGALVAPLAAPLAATLLLPVVMPGAGSFVSNAVVLLPIIAVVSIIFSYVAVFSIALPLAHALRRYGKLNAIMICGLSIPIGAALWLAVRMFDRPSQVREQLISEIIFGAGVALAVAILFSVASGLTIHSSRTRFVAR